MNVYKIVVEKSYIIFYVSADSGEEVLNILNRRNCKASCQETKKFSKRDLISLKDLERLLVRDC